MERMGLELIGVERKHESTQARPRIPCRISEKVVKRGRIAGMKDTHRSDKLEE